MKRYTRLACLAALLLVLAASPALAIIAPAANTVTITSPVDGNIIIGTSVPVTAALDGAANLQSFSAMLNGRPFSGFSLDGDNLVADLTEADGLLIGSSAPGEQNTLSVTAVFKVTVASFGRRKTYSYLVSSESEVSFYCRAPSPGPDFTITGSVSGTVVVAVVDNEIVASYDTAGLPLDVDTDGDTVNDAHSFSLAGLPQGVPIRLFVVEKGQLYFLGFANGPGVANVFSLSGTDTLDLGLVSVIAALGGAMPQFSPADNPNVLGVGTDFTLPSVLNNPDTTGMSLQELLAEGFAALRQNWILRARGFFKAAVEAAGTTPSQDRDAANLFYAGTRIISLWWEIQPGDNPAVYQTMGDLLERFGFTYTRGFRTNFRNLQALDLDNDIPADCPTGADIQDFFYNVVRPEVAGALNNLDMVSPNVSRRWYVPLLDKEVLSEYADALLLRAALKAALAAIDIQYYYDLDADFYKMIHGTQTMEDLLAGNFLKPKNPGANLEGARLLLIGALDDANTAMGLMRFRAGAPDTYLEGLFGFHPKCAPWLQIAAFSAKTAMQGKMEAELILNEIRFGLNLPAFFMGVDINAMAPPFVLNAVSGLFPDPTFGGVFPNGALIDFPNGLFGFIPEGIELNVNMDLDDNGIPDIFLLNFVASMLLDMLDFTDPPAALEDTVFFGYTILYGIFGNTLNDADVAALAEAAPYFMPAPAITAVMEFFLRIGEQFSDGIVEEPGDGERPPVN